MYMPSLPLTLSAEMKVLAKVAWKNMSVVAPAVATAAVRANGSEPVTAALKPMTFVVVAVGVKNSRWDCIQIMVTTIPSDGYNNNFLARG
jgi:hypothetical protein